MSVKRRYIATVAPFVVLFVAMALWMLSDLVGIEKNGNTYTYRVKHNFVWLFLPLAGFMFASGVFVARLGRAAALFSLLFVGFALYIGWFALTTDMSNHHVQVSRDYVYSEWGTTSNPVSASLDFRKLEHLALTSKLEGNDRRRYLVGTTRDGATIELPVNDVLQVALKRIFLYASMHKIEIEFPEIPRSQIHG